MIDVQNDLVDPAGKALHDGFAEVVAQRGIIPKLRKVLDGVRSKSVPAVLIRVGFRSDYADAISQSARLDRIKKRNALVIGTWGLDFPEAIQPLPDEIIYTKRALIKAYICGPNNVGPLGSIYAKKASELIGTAADRTDAKINETLLHIRLAQNICDLSTQLPY